PDGMEMVFRDSETNAEFHVVFPKDVAAPQGNALTNALTLQGRFRTIQPAPDGKAPQGPDRLGKRIPDGYRYFVVSRWEIRNAPALPPNDPFLKILRDRLDVELSKPFRTVEKAIDWTLLLQEAEKATSPAVRTERHAYVEFWRRLAKAHDYGMMCSRMNVFEWEACELLAGTHKPEKNTLPHADTGLPKQRACEYLLAEDLPAWGKSLKWCAAGVLAGDGDRRGMDVLIQGIRDPKETRGWSAIHEALRAAWTEKALPLWAETARDADARVRLVVVTHLNAIPSEKAVPILLDLLTDGNREVRVAAALVLMRRDVKEAAPVLLEKVRHELNGTIRPAHDNGPVCLKLQQWNVPDVPWDKMESVLTEEARANDNDYWRAVEIAGWCLAAGREVPALPFLKSAVNAGIEKGDKLPALGTMEAKELSIPWHAATILASNGRREGVELVRRYIEVGRGNWLHANEGLMALASLVNRPDAAPADFKVAMEIAAKAVERRDALFQGYFWRALEALGEMGAIVRVDSRDGRLSAKDVIALPYHGTYGPVPRYMMAEICRAKVRSIAVAAQQERIPLPEGWLAAYARAQQTEIAGTARGPAEPNAPPAHGDLQRAAEAALKALAESPPDDTVERKGP
ncbi:MAG: HEAT repeat domain-containing protein, partial [bacterium]